MEIEDSYFDDLDLDRKFFNLSSTMECVFPWLTRLVAPLEPNQFDNATTVANEVGIRALIVLGAVASFLCAGTYIFGAVALLGVGSKICKEAGYYFQKEGFTYVRGSAPEITLKTDANGKSDARLMIWNIRGYGGKLHYYFGVVHWKSRIDRIVDDILKANPDILELQDVYDTALVEALIGRLGDHYAHFYTHLGESGRMVIAKCAIDSFSYQEYSDQDAILNRGFSILQAKASPESSLPCIRIIGTELSPGKDQEETRMGQVAQIINTLAEQAFAMPTMFIGSGVDRDGKEGKLLSKYLYHSYQDKEPTHSDLLGNQWAPIYEGLERVTHFISFFKRNLTDGRVLPVIEKNIRYKDSGLVMGFDPDYNTKRARSDCNAVYATFGGLGACQKVN